MPSWGSNSVPLLRDRMEQLIMYGKVTAQQPEKHRVQVTFEDTVTSPFVSDWLPVLVPRACGDLHYDLPDVGTSVLCIFLPYALEQGFVLGCVYGSQTPPVSDPNKAHRTFSDGTTVEYDRGAHKLTINCKGEVTVNAQKKVLVNAQEPVTIQSSQQINSAAPSMSLGGAGGGATSAQMQGTFVLSNGDIIAEGISLRHHTHPCPHGGNTGEPQ